MGDEAENGVDYVTIPSDLRRVTAQPGSWRSSTGGSRVQSPSFRFATIQDTIVEPNETVTVIVSPSDLLRGLADLPPMSDSDLISIIDNDPLVISSVDVSSSPATGDYYNTGETLQFVATFTARVDVDCERDEMSVCVPGTTPELRFDMGDSERVAAAVLASDLGGSERVTFTYTVADGDEDLDGVSWRANSLQLNGGSVVASGKSLVVPRNAVPDPSPRAIRPREWTPWARRWSTPRRLRTR